MPGKHLILLLALLAPFVAWATPHEENICGVFLQSDARFFKGTHTLRGLSPDEFFANHRTSSDRPRFVMLIGIPGAGKSTWARAALRAGWTIIDNDRARFRSLEGLRACGEMVTLNDGRRELADPQNPRHFFTTETRAGLDRILENDLNEALARGVGIVSDALNIAPTRARQIHPARRHGYAVEGLVFESSSTDTNMANLRLRAKPGEFVMPHATVLKRSRLKEQYSETFRVDESYFEAPTGDLPAMSTDLTSRIFDFGVIEGRDRAVLDAYIAEDVFNRIEFVWTRDFSRRR